MSDVKLKDHILYIGNLHINIPMSLACNDLAKHEAQILCDLIEEQGDRIKELEQVIFGLLSSSSFHTNFPFEAEKLEQLQGVTKS